MEYSDNAIAIYKKLYFNRDKNDKLIEKSPVQTHTRVAQAISFDEDEYEQFLLILNENWFRPNSPVLINAGGPKQFLSACYVLGLEDSMDSIIDCWGTCAKIYASGAGAGLTLTNLRKKDGPIAFGGKASGPLSYTKVLDLYSETVKAGNKARRAANMGMLNFNHPDILDLLDCKLDKVTLKNFNLSVSIPDVFMEKIINQERDGEFSFPTYDPKAGVDSEDQIEGSHLWNKIINNCWKIGDPGLFFVDTTNEFNPFPKTHPIECTNPCGEVPLWPWSECIIGSINVSNFFWANDVTTMFDWDKFRDVVDVSFKFLDNCISKTMHPHPNLKDTMNKYRPIGLGIMGLADLFVKLKIPYDSTEAIDFFEKLCFILNSQCIITSINIAKENKKAMLIPQEDAEHFRRLISYYVKMDGHILNDYDKYGINNCTWTCIAPTGSISISADCSYSFEPLSAIVWQKEMAETHTLMNFVHPGFEEWLKTNYHLDHKKIIQEIIDNNGSIQTITEIPQEIRNIFKVAHDIDPYDKINMQAAGQKWISLAISSTCNLPEKATPEDISDIYKCAWTKKLKGITVYRDKSQEWQPINFGKKDCKTIIIPMADKDGIGQLKLTQDELIEFYIKNRFVKPQITVTADNVNITLSKPNDTIKRPIRRKGETFEIDTPHGRLYCTFNKDKEGRPLEVFLRLGKSGTLENLLLDTISRLVSKSLQNSVPYIDISSLLRGIRGDKLWFRIIEDSDSPFAAESIIDAVGIIMEVAFEEEVLKATNNIYQHDGYPTPEGEITMVHKFSLYEECPECHRFTLSRESGCRGGICKNPDCLYTNCG